MIIAAVGLNWESVSTLLALGRHDPDFNLYTWDADLDNRAAADGVEGIHRVEKKLRDAVKDADLILCGLPFVEKESIFKELMLISKRGTILVNLTPHFAATQALFNEIVSNRMIAFSLFPAVRTRYLGEIEPSIEDARSDLFDHSRCYIADPGNLDGAVLDLATDFCALLGGKPIIIGLDELDGLWSRLTITPTLIDAVLVQALTGRVGWEEGKYLAGIPTLSSTRLLDEITDVVEFVDLVMRNGVNMVANLDEYLRKLVDLRDAISNEKREKVIEMVENASQARVDWILERGDQIDRESSPTTTSVKDALRRIQKLGN